MITQGAKRMGKPEYVKSYKVAFSEDGETWRMYIDKGTDEDQVSSVVKPFKRDICRSLDSRIEMSSLHLIMLV